MNHTYMYGNPWNVTTKNIVNLNNINNIYIHLKLIQNFNIYLYI